MFKFDYKAFALWVQVDINEPFKASNGFIPERHESHGVICSQLSGIIFFVAIWKYFMVDSALKNISDQRLLTFTAGFFPHALRASGEVKHLTNDVQPVLLGKYNFAAHIVLVEILEGFIEGVDI